MTDVKIEWPVKVLSYNIHKGFSSRNKEFVLDGIREAVRTVEPDFVCLQEVLGAHQNHQHNYTNWIDAAQFEYLADEMWPHFAYGKNAIYQHGHHGNAILSMYPFSHWQNTDVSRWKFSQRGILHGVVLDQLHVLCIHFGLLKAERVQQLKILAQTIREIPSSEPLILAGDFNDWRRHTDRTLDKNTDLQEVFQSLGRRPPPTFPAGLPLLALDRIYCRGLRCLRAERLDGSIWRRLSDHRPLYAELQMVA